MYIPPDATILIDATGAPTISPGMLTALVRAVDLPENMVIPADTFPFPDQSAQLMGQNETTQFGVSKSPTRLVLWTRPIPLAEDLLMLANVILGVVEFHVSGYDEPPTPEFIAQSLALIEHADGLPLHAMNPLGWGLAHLVATKQTAKVAELISGMKETL